PIGVVIKYNAQLKKFTMKNLSDKSVWFDGYGTAAPLISVERLTSDGWVQSNFDWCGTGVRRLKLEPGKEISLAPRLKAMDYNPSTDIVIKEKYPDIDRFPVRIATTVFAREQDEVGETVWSDKVENLRQ